MFIAIEGIDGSGKTTLSNNLVDALRKSTQQRVTKVREPGSSLVAEEIRDLILRYKSEDMVKTANFLLFSAARADTVAEVIKPALERNDLVITDRYIGSSMAYQGFGNGVPLDDVYNISMFAAQGIVPDINILLMNDHIQTVLDRASKNNIRDLETIDYFKRVHWGYRQLALRSIYQKAFPLGEWVIVDALQPPETILRQVMHIIAMRLGETLIY